MEGVIFSVRRPGCSAWESFIQSPQEAARLRKEADQIDGPGHRICIQDARRLPDRFVELLMQEAGAAGDLATVEQCRMALDGDEAARESVAGLLLDAWCMWEEEP